MIINRKEKEAHKDHTQGKKTNKKKKDKWILREIENSISLNEPYQWLCSLCLNPLKDLFAEAT